MRVRIVLTIVAFGILSARSGSATPLNSCANNAHGGITCDVYEDLVGGHSTLQLPTVVNAGYVVLLQPGTTVADQTNIANWTDVAWFEDNGFPPFIAPGSGYSSFLDFYSPLCHCFPTLRPDVLDSLHTFIFQNQSGPVIDGWDVTAYQPSVNEFDFHTVPSETVPPEVPEPASLILLATGLAGGMRLRSKRR